VFDIVIRGGEIIDGSRARRFQGDLGITGERIAAIGDLRQAEAATVIDARDKIVAPGFVDVHNHSDAWLLKTPHLTSKTMQGFTTEVIMADGISYAPVSPDNAREWITYLRGLNALRFEEYTGWLTLAEYMAGLDRKNVQNSIPHVPYANVRVLAAGWGRALPDDYQMRQIVSEVEKGMAAGAVGLSTGMDYVAQWFAGTDELIEACAPLVAQH
jgi:N-acyl-D-amino-acid deacylase